jgi:hypothetical protein
VTSNQAPKKRHHFVPVTYLLRFADEAGRVYAYRKDEPLRPLKVRPREIAFERYYYSQPLQDGGQDNNRLEDLFSTVETVWPSLVDDLTGRRDITDRISTLFEFVGLMRVRGPATRDAVELFLAHMVRRTTKMMSEKGRLPAPPPGIENILDDMQISIDPHRSLHAMSSLLRGFARLLEHIGFIVLHNETDELFATSDNPVVCFDPDVPEHRLRPYEVHPPQGRVQLFMPLSPRLLLSGSTEFPRNSPGLGIHHGRISRRSEIVRVNRMVARFGYRLIFAHRGGLERFVARYAATSPTPDFESLKVEGGEFNVFQMVFGPRPTKPKWQGPRSAAEATELR